MNHTGLTSFAAAERLQKDGPNRLPEPSPPGLLLNFLRQFLSPLIYILLAAALVSLLVGEYSDAAFIFLVLFVNAAIGAGQEHSAEKAAQALKNIVPQTALVLRDGHWTQVSASHLVIGDLVAIESGDKVPADLNLVESVNLQIDESLLTGESLPVEKNHQQASTADTVLAERLDQAFAGTNVLRGRGQGVVTATALHTQLGHIVESTSNKTLNKPPLLQRIERFTLGVSIAMLLLIFLVFIISLSQGGNLIELFLLAVALAVAAIPEGLPAAITITLAIGMRRMTESNVIIRKLMAVEALGSCTFIASDKTGTLTKNELTIQHVAMLDGTLWQAEHGSNRTLDTIKPLITAGILANEAQFENGQYTGDAVDVAFLKLGQQLSFNRKGLLAEYTILNTLPYESKAAFSAVLCSHKLCSYKQENQNTTMIFAKGSAEKLASICQTMQIGQQVQPIDITRIENLTHQLANNGFKVLALAQGQGQGQANTEDWQTALQQLTFLGLVAMSDPVRPEAVDAVKLCHKAGIEVAMVTGDHPVTAQAIAKGLHFTDQTTVLTGDNLHNLQQADESAFDQAVKKTHIFARIEPSQKQQIVQSMIRSGHFVAVTGDGVNDAPALKSAHVGVAMGKRGTDFARECADLIITDDNFNSIIEGVRIGRIVYQNIRKVILLLVATGAAEILLFILTLLAGLPMPLLAVQLLWLNLVSNGVQDIAMAFEPGEGDELTHPPRPPKEPIFNKLMISRILVSAIWMGGVAFGVFKWCLGQGMALENARNITLLMMVFFENIHALNSRSETKSIFQKPFLRHFFSNKWLLISIVSAQLLYIGSLYTPILKDVLQVQPISITTWGIMCLLACSLILVEEIHKLLLRKT